MKIKELDLFTVFEDNKKICILVGVFKKGYEGNRYLTLDLKGGLWHVFERYNVNIVEDQIKYHKVFIENILKLGITNLPQHSKNVGEDVRRR